MILAEGRSGSNWLADILRSHPNCFCYGELFLELPEWEPLPDDRWSYLLAKFERAELRAGVTHVGFKHLPSFDPAPVRRLLSDPRYRVVVLRRRDRLAQFASEMIARQTGQWAATAESPAPDQVRVRFVVRDFIDFCREAEAWFATELRLLRDAGRRPCEIFYEELEEGTALPAVLAYLGLPPSEGLASRHRRLNSPDPYARFANRRRARVLAPLIRWRPTRKLIRILRGIRPLRRFLD